MIFLTTCVRVPVNSETRIFGEKRVVRLETFTVQDPSRLIDEIIIVERSFQ